MCGRKKDEELGVKSPDEVGCFGFSRSRLLTASRTALGVFIASLPIILGSKHIEAHNGVIAMVLVGIAMPVGQRIGSAMEQVKVCLASGVLGYICSVPWQKLIWVNEATPWIGVAWLVVVGMVGSVLVSWLDPKMSALPILRLALLFIAMAVTFSPSPSSSPSHWNAALQLLLMHCLAAAIVLVFGLLTPFVATHVNSDFASMAHNCRILFDEMADQLKLTKQDSLENDPSVLDITDEQNLLEFDQLRRQEEKKVHRLEDSMVKRMKVIKLILDEAQLERWADPLLVANHAPIYKDLDRLVRDFIQMRIALETGFIPRLSLILVQPLLPRFTELRNTIHDYIALLEASLHNMFNPHFRPPTLDAPTPNSLKFEQKDAPSDPSSPSSSLPSTSSSGSIEIIPLSPIPSYDQGDHNEASPSSSKRRPRTPIAASETLTLSKNISIITQDISRTWTDNLKRLLDKEELKLSPTAEITRLNFFLWRVAELRKRLKSLEHSVKFQMRQANTLGKGWVLRAHLSAIIAPFIGLLQGIFSVTYMALAMLIRFGLWIIHPCCCSDVKWENLRFFGGRAKTTAPEVPTNVAHKVVSDVEGGMTTESEMDDGRRGMDISMHVDEEDKERVGSGKLKGEEGVMGGRTQRMALWMKQNKGEKGEIWPSREVASKDSLVSQFIYGSASEYELSDLEMTSGEEDAMEVVIELPEPALAQKGGFRMGTGVKLTNSFFKDWVKGGGWRFPLRMGIALVLSASLALAVQLYALPSVKAAWACVTVLIVFVPSLGGTMKRAMHRLVGTFLGSSLALLTVLLGHYTHRYLTFFPYMLFTFVVTYLQNATYKPKPYSWTVANFTYSLILMLSWPFTESPKTYTWLAGYRFIQVLLGGILVVLCANLLPERATDLLRKQLLLQAQKSVHAFIEMVALMNSAIQETGKITKLVNEAHELVFSNAQLIKLAKAEMTLESLKETIGIGRKRGERQGRRQTMVMVTQQLELISDILIQMCDTLKAGFSQSIRDFISPFSDQYLSKCVLFIEEDALLVYSYLSTFSPLFRPEPTRIPSILQEMDAFYLHLRSSHHTLNLLYPEAFRFNAFLHATRLFIVAFSNLVFFITEPEQHNQLIHLYSR